MTDPEKEAMGRALRRMLEDNCRHQWIEVNRVDSPASVTVWCPSCNAVRRLTEDAIDRRVRDVQ